MAQVYYSMQDIPLVVCAVADLPTTNLKQGQECFATDGLKATETAGNGTGVKGYWDGSAWVRHQDGTAVAA